MFLTILVHHQEQLYKLYVVFGICRYTYACTSGCVWLQPIATHSQMYDDALHIHHQTEGKRSVFPENKKIVGNMKLF